MNNKEREFTKQNEFIKSFEALFGIKLQPYQIAYLKFLDDPKHNYYSGAANYGKTFLWEKYVEFKQIYEKDNSDFSINPSI